MSQAAEELSDAKICLLAIETYAKSLYNVPNNVFMFWDERGEIKFPPEVLKECQRTIEEIKGKGDGKHGAFTIRNFDRAAYFTIHKCFDGLHLILFFTTVQRAIEMLHCFKKDVIEFEVSAC